MDEWDEGWMVGLSERVRLSPQGHAVYEIDEGLLLVFKPAGHVESVHAHEYAQTLRVLRGQLRVETAGKSVDLAASGEDLSIPNGQPHSTRALAPTWLIADSRVAPAAAGEN